MPDTSNKITAIDHLLARLVLTGWVVTTNALLTQSGVAQRIRDVGGDCLMALKSN